LLVDVTAVRMGAADIAVGDLLGSSLFNLLILALLDCAYVPRWRMLSPVSAAHALSATQSIALTALAGIGILLGRAWPVQHWGASARPSWPGLTHHGFHGKYNILI
jgi:cation:H+ antiporter